MGFCCPRPGSVLSNALTEVTDTEPSDLPEQVEEVDLENDEELDSEDNEEPEINENLENQKKKITYIKSSGRTRNSAR